LAGQLLLSSFEKVLASAVVEVLSDAFSVYVVEALRTREALS
jgi:hypothetical protein